MQKGFPSHRLTEFGCLTQDDIEAIRTLGGAPIEFQRQSIIRLEGSSDRSMYLLVEGWVSSSMFLRGHERQIINLHLAGDMLGGIGLCVDAALDTLTALTPVVVRKVPLKALGDVMAASPRVAAFMLLLAQREQIALMDRVAWIGRSSATTRIASFLLDLSVRLRAAGLTNNDSFVMPVTQEQIGDLLGLTAVHVNRVLQELERSGLISRRRNLIQLPDVERLKQAAALPLRRISADLSWFGPCQIAGHHLTA